MKTRGYSAAFVAPAMVSVLWFVTPVAAESLAGQFAFDWHKDPAKVRCAAVTGALLKRLQSPDYTCAPTKSTASEVPATACASKDAKSEYLVFAKQAACETERKTQESNGD